MNTYELIYALIFSAVLIVPLVIWTNDKRDAEEFNEKYPCSTQISFKIRIK